MFKNYLNPGLAFLVITFHTPPAAFSINYKLLDPEADACISKIWAGIPVPKKQIKDKLYFLHDDEVVEENI